MNWFLSRSVFQIVSFSSNHSSQFEEQFNLIEALDSITGYKKAKVNSEKYVNKINKEKELLVNWNLVAIVDIIPIENLKDCVEVFYKIEQHIDPNSYLLFLKLKEKSLLNKLSIHLCNQI